MSDFARGGGRQVDNHRHLCICSPGNSVCGCRDHGRGLGLMPGILLGHWLMPLGSLFGRMMMLALGGGVPSRRVSLSRWRSTRKGLKRNAVFDVPRENRRTSAHNRVADCQTPPTGTALGAVRLQAATEGDTPPIVRAIPFRLIAIRHQCVRDHGVRRHQYPKVAFPLTGDHRRWGSSTHGVTRNPDLERTNHGPIGPSCAAAARQDGAA